MDPLITLAQVKAYCRIEDDAEDGLITDFIIPSAQAAVFGSFPRSIDSVTSTETRTVGRNANAIQLTNWPIDPSVPVVVIGPGNAQYSIGGPVGAGDPFYPMYGAWSADESTPMMYVTPETGMVKTGYAYGERLLLTPGSYQITYKGGMESDPRWETGLKRQLALAVLYTAQDMYDNRNSRSIMESDGDMRVQFAAGKAGSVGVLPPRAESIVDSLVGAVVA